MDVFLKFDQVSKNVFFSHSINKIGFLSVLNVKLMGFFHFSVKWVKFSIFNVFKKIMSKRGKNYDFKSNWISLKFLSVFLNLWISERIESTKLK